MSEEIGELPLEEADDLNKTHNGIVGVALIEDPFEGDAEAQPVREYDWADVCGGLLWTVILIVFFGVIILLGLSEIWRMISGA